jgi:hypothetical protein
VLRVNAAGAQHTVGEMSDGEDEDQHVEDEVDEGFCTGTELESVSWHGGRHPSTGYLMSSSDDQEGGSEDLSVAEDEEGQQHVYEGIDAEEAEVEVEDYSGAESSREQSLEIGHMVISVRAAPDRSVQEGHMFHS